MPTVTQAEYAEIRGVGRDTIAHYIARGQLTAPALTENRRIDVEAADAQLAETLDAGASAAARDRPGTRRNVAEANGAATALMRARAVSATVAAERDRRRLNMERGRYVLADQTMEATGRLVSEFINQVELGLEDLAERCGLNRQQLTEAKKWWREQRRIAADRLGAQADSQPEFIADDAA